MSALLMGRAFYVDLPAHLKLTLLALADFANDDGGGVWAGQRHIALKTGQGERTIRRNLADLTELGFLEELGRTRMNTKSYRIDVARLPSTSAIEALKSNLRAPARLAAAGSPVTIDPKAVPARSAGGPDEGYRPPTAGGTGHPRPEVPATGGQRTVREPSENHPMSAPPAARARDEIWDALVAIYGEPPPAPHNARARMNTAAKQARLAGSGPVELAELHAWATAHRDDSIRRRVQTAIALTTNIPDLRRMHQVERVGGHGTVGGTYWDRELPGAEAGP